MYKRQSYISGLTRAEHVASNARGGGDTKEAKGKSDADAAELLQMRGTVRLFYRHAVYCATEKKLIPSKVCVLIACLTSAW